MSQYPHANKASQSIRFPVAFFSSLLAIAAPGSLAEAASFTVLPYLPGQTSGTEVFDVSGDGSVVVGATSSAQGTQAFRWTQSGGMVGLGTLGGSPYYSAAYGVSDAGLTVVGCSQSPSGIEAFRWTQSSGMVAMGDLPGGTFYSAAKAASADGSVIVGFGRSASSYEAFRWTLSGGMVGLGLLNGSSTTNSVSGDGTVAAGEGNGTGGGGLALRWTQSEGIMPLGDLPGGIESSAAYAVSADGSTIVGRATSASGFEAFRWTQASGMVGLGDLPGGSFDSYANGVSSDGSIVVGKATTGAGSEAFIWDATNGMRRLQDVLTALGLDMTGWRLATARSISADGTTIVGGGVSPGGSTESWVAVLGECMPIQITQQPVNVAAVITGSAQFAIQAQGTGITYQWKRGDGTSVANEAGHIAGAATSTLTINPVRYSDSGTYYVVCSNTCTPSITSDPATLTVRDEDEPTNPNLDHQLGQPVVTQSARSNDPVNTATGNFTHAETDLSIAARGIPLLFSRYYNSRDSYSGPLGPGWSHTYDITLTQNSSIVTIKWADGRVDRYSDRGNNTFMSIYEGVHDTLTRDQGTGVWTVQRKDLSAHKFTAAGKLSSIADRNGNTLTCAYDSYGNLADVRDASERHLTLFYDKGLLVELRDPIGRAVRFRHTNGRLTSVTDVLGHTIQYTYDAGGRLSTIIDQRGVTTVTNIYDADGRVVEQRDGRSTPNYFTYNTPNPGDTTLTDALGHSIVHTHQDFLLKRITYPNSSTIEYAYDGLQNRTSIKDRNGHTVHFVYDARGNVTRTTAPDGGITTLEYTDNRFPDLPTRKTDAVGKVMDWSYDAKGNLLTERRAVGTPSQCQKSWTYNSWGQVATSTDERNAVTRFTYYTSSGLRQGLLMSVQDALGWVTNYNYDNLWRRTQVIDARGGSSFATTYTYDNGDRLTSITGPPVGDPAQAIVRTYQYDSIGNRTQITDGSGNIRTYEYDENSNLRFVREPLGRTTEYRYDALNRKAATIDPNGHETDYAYDVMGNMISTTRKMYGDGGDLLTTYTYDPHGNMLAVVDPSSRTTTYSYDAMHRRVSQTDDLGNQWEWQYDAMGRVIASIDPMEHPSAYAYDDLGRLVGVTVWNDQGQPEMNSYRYDAVGNLTQITDAGGRLTWKSYDPVGRLSMEQDGLGNQSYFTYDPVGNRISTRDANGQTTTLFYDAENRLTGIIYPDSTQITYTYDANGNRTSMTDSTGQTVYTYDALDQLTSTTDSFGLTVGYSYDPSGNRISLTYPGNLLVAYSYDAADRVRTVTDWAARTTEYEYDQASRIVGIHYPNGVVHSRVYDGCGRLSSMTDVRDSTVLLGYSWTRDADGLPISQNEIGTLPPTFDLPAQVNYSYDADNRLTVSTVGTYTHDNNGNLISRTVDGVTINLQYDYADRLVRQIAGARQIGHVYDGDGNRISWTIGPIARRYVLDRGRSMSHVLCETTGTGTVLAYYIHGPQLVARIAPDGSQRYYHTDAVGNVAALTDQAGAVTDRYAYEPFGVPAGREGSSANPFTYVGGFGVMTEPDGLYFMRARFYDPRTGRFLSKDPVPASLVSPAVLQRYQYARGNPNCLLDPSGLFPQDLGGFGNALVGSAGDLLGGGAMMLLTLPAGAIVEALAIGEATIGMAIGNEGMRQQGARTHYAAWGVWGYPIEKYGTRLWERWATGKPPEGLKLASGNFATAGMNVQETILGLDVVDATWSLLGFAQASAKTAGAIGASASRALSRMTSYRALSSQRQLFQTLSYHAPMSANPLAYGESLRKFDAVQWANLEQVLREAGRTLSQSRDLVDDWNDFLQHLQEDARRSAAP